MRLRCVVFSAAVAATLAPVEVRPVLGTDPVSKDPDDPAVWVNPVNPASSLIVGTNKTAAPDGAVVVFDLNGKTKQTISGIDRPNNVDIEYGLRLNGRNTDIAVLTERLKQRLRVFAISAAGLRDISADTDLSVFAGEQGPRAAPMGIALYRRPRDGAIFAIVSRKTGPLHGYLWQYRLEDNGSGRVRAVKVREFGDFSGDGEIEAVAVDDELGFVYYADENFGIRKWSADPDDVRASRELAVFGQEGFRGNREGIAIYSRPGGKGYIVCTDQIRGGSLYRIYPREGSPGRPHEHPLIKVIQGGADATDGLEITPHPLGPRFPSGLMIAMNSSGRNFLLYSWRDIARAGAPQLLE